MRSSSSVLVSLLHQVFYQLLFLIVLSYLFLTMGMSYGVTGEMSPWCLIYKCCKIKQPDSFWSSCALFCIRGTEETCIGWKSLLRRRMEHQAIFMYKLRNSHFYCLIPVSFNCDFHDYYTRSTNDILKSSATRRWGHWSSVHFSSNI